MTADQFHADVRRQPADRAHDLFLDRIARRNMLLAAALHHIDSSTPSGCGVSPDPGGEAGSGTNFQEEP